MDVRCVERHSSRARDGRGGHADSESRRGESGGVPEVRMMFVLNV